MYVAIFIIPHYNSRHKRRQRRVIATLETTPEMMNISTIPNTFKVNFDAKKNKNYKIELRNEELRTTSNFRSWSQ